MVRKMRTIIVVGVMLLVSWLAVPATAQAQDYNLNQMFYYPYYNFQHNYWPQQQDPYPERPGEPYRRPPAYMAYPPFHPPHWRFELSQPMPYYRGFHFWLDQF